MAQLNAYIKSAGEDSAEVEFTLDGTGTWTERVGAMALAMLTESLDEPAAMVGKTFTVDAEFWS